MFSGKNFLDFKINDDGILERGEHNYYAHLYKVEASLSDGASLYFLSENGPNFKLRIKNYKGCTIFKCIETNEFPSIDRQIPFEEALNGGMAMGRVNK